MILENMFESTVWEGFLGVIASGYEFTGINRL